MTKRNIKKAAVYSIGNPLIDVIAEAEDHELESLKMDKGKMSLIDNDYGNYILKYIDDREKMFSCGGSAPNTMITLAALGVRTALAGMVGNDKLGSIYKNRLKEKNVLSDLASCEGDTGTCIILVTPDYERTMNTRLGVCRQFGPDNVNHKGIAAAEYLYFTGYMWDTENQKKALISAIDTAHKHGTKVVFDLADPLLVERHYDELLKLLAEKVDILFANREEAAILIGCDDPEKAACDLAEKCSIAAVKNSADGSCIASEDGRNITVAAYEVDAADSTGAGDNYAAGFLYGLITGCSLDTAGSIASYVAAQIVRQTGAQFSETGISAIHQKLATDFSVKNNC